MIKEVKTAGAPQAIGPYSQGMVANGFVFCSGQISLDPKTGETVGDTIQAQTEQVLKNLFEVLKEAGSSPGRVVKTTVLLQDMGDFTEMNKVYERMFEGFKPARAAFAVKTLPKNVLIEIEAVAIV
ncbi:MAG: RidA family protein [Acidobacteria bacterium]|nr:RidA family protein [Acidobacteriota bacterium]